MVYKYFSRLKDFTDFRRQPSNRSQIGKDFEQLLTMETAQAGDIARLHSLVESLSRNQELGLTQIGQIAEIFALTDTILEGINRKLVLKGLEFDQIETRHEQMSQAARDTFLVHFE